MPFSSGVFSRIYDWTTDKANLIKIRADRMDEEFDGMATALSTAICRDGQSTISANIPFNNKLITGLGDATAATHALNRQAADARFVQNPNALTADTGIDVADVMSFWDTSAAVNKGITYANFKADLVTEGIAGVASVYGRTGAVVAVAGDYTATKITNTPAGTIAATNVQTALNELDTEKMALAGGTFTGGVTFTSAGITVGASIPFSDAAGTLTLQNVSVLDATTESTIEAAIDTLANLTSIQGQTVTLTGALIRSGAHSLTLTTTGATSVTLPTSGTLSTSSATETLSNKSVALSSNTVTGTTAQFNTALTDNDFATLAGSETLTNKSLTSPTMTGTPVSTTATPGTATTQVATTAFVDSEIDQYSYSLTATVAANALTIALKTLSAADASAADPIKFRFRSATLTSGAVVERSVTAANSLVISSGSTMGASNSTPFRLWLVLFDDAGTLRLGLINCFNSATTAITPLTQAGVRSSTAEGGAGAADSAGTIYTGTAVTSKSYLVLGYLEWTTGLATAGTWNAAPDVLQFNQVALRMPGVMIQSVFKADNAFAVLAGTVPFDDTIPQNTEGTQINTLAITPTSPCNHLTITANADAILSTFAGTDVIALSLFQDSTAAALSTAAAESASQFPGCMTSVHRMLAATASATTFKWRAGASASTCYVNGNSGGTRSYGGALAFRMHIVEVQT